MIIITNATKIYKSSVTDVPALDNVSLEIKNGDFVAIVGASGSGKTTLLNVIGGLDDLQEGEYTYGDINVSTLTENQLNQFRKKYISFVFQNFALLNDYTVLENVELPLRVKKMVAKKRREKAFEVLKSVGMDAYAKQYPTKLSGGQQQRVAIARALAVDAEVILADEPTGALDRKTGQDIIDILKELNEKGKTVIIVTHDEKIAAQTRHIIRLDDGRVIEDTYNINKT